MCVLCVINSILQLCALFFLRFVANESNVPYHTIIIQYTIYNFFRLSQSLLLVAHMQFIIRQTDIVFFCECIEHTEHKWPNSVVSVQIVAACMHG